MVGHHQRDEITRVIIHERRDVEAFVAAQ